MKHGESNPMEERRYRATWCIWIASLIVVGIVHYVCQVGVSSRLLFFPLPSFLLLHSKIPPRFAGYVTRPRDMCQ